MLECFACGPVPPDNADACTLLDGAKNVSGGDIDEACKFLAVYLPLLDIAGLSKVGGPAFLPALAALRKFVGAVPHAASLRMNWADWLHTNNLDHYLSLPDPTVAHTSLMDMGTNQVKHLQVIKVAQEDLDRFLQDRLSDSFPNTSKR